MAIHAAPGVLAVEVDYKTGKATIGTNSGSEVPADEIVAALESIGYRGEFVQSAEDANALEGANP